MTTNEALEAYLCSLDNRERRAKSRDIRETLKITRQKLFNWTHGVTPLHIVFLDKIGEIVGKDLSSNVTE